MIQSDVQIRPIVRAASLLRPLDYTGAAIFGDECVKGYPVERPACPVVGQHVSTAKNHASVKRSSYIHISSGVNGHAAFFHVSAFGLLYPNQISQTVELREEHVFVRARTERQCGGADG